MNERGATKMETGIFFCRGFPPEKEVCPLNKGRFI